MVRLGEGGTRKEGPAFGAAIPGSGPPRRGAGGGGQTGTQAGGQPLHSRCCSPLQKDKKRERKQCFTNPGSDVSLALAVPASSAFFRAAGEKCLPTNLTERGRNLSKVSGL